MASNQERSYDVIGFGDEVPGILALIAAGKEYRRRTGKYPRILLMSKGSKHEGVGGHLVRGGLAYLDRCQIPRNLRKSLKLDTFGSPPSLYKEFLKRSGVNLIALDPRKADATLKKMMQEAGVALIREVKIESVIKDGPELAGIKLARGETYFAKQFIDSTVNGELAQAAGVRKLKGFNTFGLPESELPVTLVFETEGLSIKRLKQVEYAYLKRFANPADHEAQRWLKQAAGSDAQFAERLRKNMRDPRGNLKTMWVGKDYIDIRSPALSVAYHSFRGKTFSLAKSGVILDEGNVAILPGGRLSWNALLCKVNGSEAEELAKAGAKPSALILEEMNFIETWLKGIGAKAVKPASELYIRHAGNITGVVDPLYGSQMLLGGTPNWSALGTFGYHFDVRGGIEGLGNRASQNGFKSVSFSKPIFNIGIQHAQIKAVPNLAVVSPGSGFQGFASSAGRIVEFNAGVGQALGIAAITALLSGRNLSNVSNSEVRKVLLSTKQLPRVYGYANNNEAKKLKNFESLLVLV
ncbi:MAG: FAD-dependent oxidoreductase [Moorea sp. SIO1G6]|uniref:FAD-dependent oxidoreductase n=1 Tax=Moorena producens (strain JHB) TaxID=1454205 RepID=A0A1D9G9J6_MOOP1|nr:MULTISPECIES: FAD-dependent oxidoreductase [Moorena]AOY84298.1 FAD-dependent oxidoreductase [Moorena producens JHB]NES80844.1 FAD-dependent oxidoreductase [Moorena sp. SIO2B7]NET66961.1 FAD-dependent oxidoreductase [Moorena sp. SIO1G6]